MKRSGRYESSVSRDHAPGRSLRPSQRSRDIREALEWLGWLAALVEVLSARAESRISLQCALSVARLEHSSCGECRLGYSPRGLFPDARSLVPVCRYVSGREKLAPRANVGHWKPVYTGAFCACELASVANERGRCPLILRGSRERYMLIRGHRKALDDPEGR